MFPYYPGDSYPPLVLYHKGPKMAAIEVQELLTTLHSHFPLRSSSENNLLSSVDSSPSQYYMLRYHRDRLVDAAMALSWPAATKSISGYLGMVVFHDALDEHLRDNYPNLVPGSAPTGEHSGPVRIRVTINRAGVMKITSTPFAPPPLELAFPNDLTALIPRTTKVWRIQLSPIPIAPALYTKYKTTARSRYDAARAYLPKDTTDVELLVFNPKGELMEGTLTTPYFFREGRWVTPAKECGGQRGTTRRWALNKGLCYEGVVKRESIRAGEVAWLSNGVKGFGWGLVEIEEETKEKKRKLDG